MPEAIGTLLNSRYQLEAELGRGGMGVVYRAHDTLLGRDVAVKVLSATALGTEGRAYLLREAQAAALLNHPNIVTVHDAGEAQLPDSAGPAGPMPFVVMELVAGPSLHDRRPDSLEETVVVARQVCAALEHAHARGIVHRDLKPENVLLSHDPLARASPLAGTSPTAKLSDFGLARSVASRLSVEGEIVGTVFYLAPELALGQAYDGRADLYALGIMLYELAIGRLPFIADDPLAVITQHLHSPVVPPRAKNADIPPALDVLIVRLLSKDPQDRPASAAEVRRALDAPDILDHDAIPARELSVLERIERGRLVARERELSRARALWRRARAGEGGMLLVSGEPGIGKTRLVRELVTQVRVAGGQVLVGECYAEGIGPHAPFAQILHRAFEDGTEDAFGLPDFVLADLLILSPALRLRYPDLPPNPPLDPKAEQLRLFENVVAFCAALSERAPLLMVLEDAHWADGGTLSLLRHLARRTRRQRVMIVATYREVELDATHPFHELLLDLDRRNLATRLKLFRLGQEGTRDMLAALFAEEVTPEFLAGIYTETEGNPFFIEEVCKALVESGQVYYVDGYWDRPDMEELEVPQSVRVAIQSRVGRLPSQVQEILCLAAIVGREFDFDTLAQASELEEESLVDALESAERAQLIGELSGRAGGTFSFTHGLIPATLTEGLSGLRRRRLHRRVAEVIEALHPDDGTHLAALAYHYSQAGVEDKAVRYLRRAGGQAAAQYANTEAVAYFSRALALTSETDLAGRYVLLLAREKVRDLQGARAAQSQDLDALGELADALDDDGLRGEVALRRASYAEAMGDYPASVAATQEAIRLAQAAQDVQLEAAGYRRWGCVLWHQGDLREARPRLETALTLARQGALRAVEAESLRDLGTISSQLGDYDRSVGHFEQALSILREIGDRRGAGMVLNNLGIVNRLLANYAASQAYLGRSLALRRQIGDRRGEGAVLNNMGVNCRHQGDYVGARTHFEQALAISRELGDRWTEGRTLGNLGMSLANLGDYARAQAHIEESLRICREIGDQGSQVVALGNLGVIHHCQGDDQAAQQHALEALHLAQERHLDSHQAHVLSDLGNALAGLSHLAEAVDTYRQAIALRREIGQLHLAIESVALLAGVLHRLGHRAEAQTHVTEVLAYLDGGGRLDGVEDAVRVYLICYQVLQVAQDPRAQGLLNQGYALLQEQAAKIEDRALRRSFLENVPSHRELLAAYRAKPEAGEHAGPADAPGG